MVKRGFGGAPSLEQSGFCAAVSTGTGGAALGGEPKSKADARDRRRRRRCSPHRRDETVRRLSGWANRVGCLSAAPIVYVFFCQQIILMLQSSIHE
jgi:hypothetical protein